MQESAGARSPSPLPTTNLFASFSCQASPEHWPCYQSLRSPHECRRRESWIARPWLVQGWVPHHATHPPAPAAGHQDDEPQENPAAGARVQHSEPLHPPGGTAQLVRGGGLGEGVGAGSCSSQVARCLVSTRTRSAASHSLHLPEESSLAALCSYSLS